MKHTKKGELFTDLALEIFRLNGLLLAEGDRISGEIGLSSARWKVLGAISLNGEPMTVAQISRQMGQARQSVQRIADSMTENGYCVWLDNPSHKRAKWLQLTEKGETAFRHLEAAQSPWANEASDSLTVEELRCSLRAVKKLINWFDR